MTVRYDFTFTGTTPLLMHCDDVLLADELKEWRKDEKNKASSTAGDDRSPAWTWQTYLYVNDATGKIAMPTANIMTCLRTAGSKKIMKKQTTYKEKTQSGLLIDDEYCTFLCNGKELDFGKLKNRDSDFHAQVSKAKSYGFNLSLKRATVGMAKHVRVRPRFDKWEVRGVINVMDEKTFGPKILEEILEHAGNAGLGDWRPSSPRAPGSFGMFTAAIKRAR